MRLSHSTTGWLALACDAAFQFFIRFAQGNWASGKNPNNRRMFASGSACCLS